VQICAHKEEHKVVEVGEGDKEIAGEADRATEGEFGEGGGEGGEGFVGADDRGVEQEFDECDSG